MRMRFCAVACALAPVYVWAGNFQQAFEAAMLNDATFQSARAELASAQQNLPLARAAQLPSISLSVSDTKVEGTRKVDTVNGQPFETPLDYRAPSQSLNFRAPLFNLEAWRKVEYAQAQISYAEAVFATRKSELLDRLATAYLQLFMAQQGVSAANAQVDASRAQVDLARRRSQLGEGTRPDLVDAESQALMADALLLEALDKLAISRLTVRQIAGTELTFAATDGAAGSPGLLREISIPPGSLSELIGRAETANPGIASRRYAVLANQAAVARAEAGHYPRLDLVASASRSRNDSISTLNQSVNQRTLGLQFTLPLYAGGAVNASVAQALADQAKAEADLLAEQQSVSLELTKLHSSLSTSAVKIPASVRVLESAQVGLEAAVKGLKTGFNVQADVVTAQRKVAQARYDLAQAVADYLAARLRLQARTGADLLQAAAQLDELLPLVPVSAP